MNSGLRCMKLRVIGSSPQGVGVCASEESVGFRMGSNLKRSDPLDLQTSADRFSSASKRRQQIAMGDSPWNTIKWRRSREAATGEGSTGSPGGGVAHSEIDVRCRLFEAWGTRGMRVHGLSPMAIRCRLFEAEDPRIRTSQ